MKEIVQMTAKRLRLTKPQRLLLRIESVQLVVYVEAQDFVSHEVL